MSKIKILFISSRSDIGGGPKHLLNLCEALSAEHFIATAAPAGHHFSGPLAEKSNIFIPIPHRRFSLVVLCKLLYLCKKEKIKNVHSHGRGAGYYSRLLKLFGMRVIHTFHGIHTPPTLSGRIKYFADYFLKPLTDVFICVSDSEREIALAKGLSEEKKTITIPNGVPVQNEVYRSQNQPFTFGTLSRITHPKGLDILVRFCQKAIKDDGINFQVVIAGGGELYETLQEQINGSGLEERIHLIGEQKDPQGFLKTIDAYISFSRREGMPLGVMEAMAAGIPCLLSDVAGNKDLVANMEDGLLFSLNSYEDFFEKISFALSNQDRFNEFGKRGQLKVSRLFSIKKMATNISKLYR